MTRPTPRTPTETDRLAERYVLELAALEPVAATFWGLPGHEAELPDLSPDGRAEVQALRARTLDAVADADPVDDTDRVTVAALRETLEVESLIYDTGDPAARVAVIESPVQSLSETFDLMPRETDEDWSTIATRLSGVPAAVEGYLASLQAAADRGRVAPRRQLLAGVHQARDCIGATGSFARIAGESPAPNADLDRGAQAASRAFEQIVEFVEERLLPVSVDHDPVGAERYALYSRAFLGTRIDLAESYEWGQAELARIQAEMAATAERIRPGAGIEEARQILDADPARQIAGTEALRAWMQQTSDASVAELGARHFDIAEPIRTLRCRIAPGHSGVIYYTNPSEDFSRPGQMWWSVPEGDTEFTTWRQRSTVHHEGVPGHHLQVGQAVHLRGQLNLWRRTASWVSGHGEGWALYAERLMAELGYLDDPGDYLGMLEGQALRAVRVVIDIGVHCGFPAPAAVGGGEWTYDKAWALLSGSVSDSEAVLRFELDRYLGWPGQAPSYKLGERFWLQLRADAQARAGAAFDLKSFHSRALSVGSVGLDALRLALLD